MAVPAHLPELVFTPELPRGGAGGGGAGLGRRGGAGGGAAATLKPLCPLSAVENTTHCEFAYLRDLLIR